MSKKTEFGKIANMLSKLQLWPYTFDESLFEDFGISL